MIATHVLIGKSDAIAAKSGRSGINKLPQKGPVTVDASGLAGDTIVDKDNHGGRDQAVYIFGQNDYCYWERALEKPLNPGTFGENLIISDLSTHDVRVGDTLEIGDVKLEATFPRIPCVTLAARMSDALFPKRFSKSGHVGVYARVVQSGTLKAGLPAIYRASKGADILSLLPGYRPS